MRIEAKIVAILDLHHSSWPSDWWLRVLLHVSRAVRARWELKYICSYDHEATSY